MRSVLPGAPVVEHIRNAPSRGMGIGAALMIIGMFVMMVGPLGESTKNPVLTYIGIGGALAMFVGILTLGFSYIMFDRQLKKSEE